jgi:hypothetical protein
MTAHKKNASSRGPSEPFSFDFNADRSVGYHAANAVAADDLQELFDTLGSVDQRLWDKKADNRQAALDALEAVNRFLNASPLNARGRFSRALELLWAELIDAPDANPGEILYRRDRDASGSTRKRPRYYAMAAAAHAADAMHGAGTPLDTACENVVAILEAHGFQFGRERATDKKRADAIKAWRKGNAARAVSLYFDKMTGSSPIPRDDVWNADKTAAIRAWLATALVRCGYESTK